jgi:hypothetical protein
VISFFRRLFADAAPIPTPASCPVMSSWPTVSVLNLSSVVTDAQIAAVVDALQIQVTRDFAPVWKTGATVRALPTGTAPDMNDWLIYVMDTSDQAGALGYHDVTAQGNPVGKIFAKDDLHYGLSWSVTLSHELLEMLADPFIQNSVFSQTGTTTGTIYALEVCDACESDSFGYKIGDVLVSDFVFPAWFERSRPAGSTQFDYTHTINMPLTLASGGYISVFAVPPTAGWTQITAETVPPTRLKLKGENSRASRRQKKWAASESR